jgi:CheY-like chemotaxis protein
MPGGGRLTIETANVVLDQDYAARHIDVEPGAYVLLAISDTGAGMSEDVKRHLFEPFFTTKAAGKGTGLGLATVYGIVKQSGGHIWVYSEPGQGSTFKIYLPRAEQDVGQTVACQPEAPLPRGTETVLLVEDDDGVRSLSSSLLAGLGYRVLEAGDAQQAVRIAAESEDDIQLLITDVILPGMNGKELSVQLCGLRPGLKVLFVSGYTDDAIVHHGVLQRGVAFLQKPFNLVSLAQKVRDALGGSGGSL